MNLLLTVFGGLVLTVALFGMARGLRLSVYWAALIAAGVPSISYLVYASQVWPGLDVVTLHVIAYPTVGMLLYQIFSTRSENPGKMHWAPKLLVAFFVFLTILFSGFVHVASHGLPPAMAAYLLPNAANNTVHTGFAGVVSHTPEAAKVIGYYMNMEHKLDRLGWQVHITGLDTLVVGVEDTVRVDVRDKAGEPVGDVRVMLGLGRPGQASHRVLAMAEVEAGSYRADLGLEQDGQWLAMITLERDGERVVLEHVLGKE